MSPRWADTSPYVGATPLGPLDLPHPSVGWLPRSTPHCLSLSPTGRCPGRDTNILPVRDRSLPGPQTCWRLLPAAPGRRRALPLIYCSQGHRPLPLTIAVSVARFDALPLQGRLRACRDEWASLRWSRALPFSAGWPFARCIARTHSRLSLLSARHDSGCAASFARQSSSPATLHPSTAALHGTRSSADAHNRQLAAWPCLEAKLHRPLASR